MSKFKVGDKVGIKLPLIKWYLSSEGQDSYFPASGKQDAYQSEQFDRDNIAMMTLAMDQSIQGEIIHHNWPGSKDMENFRVRVLNASFNIEPKYLVRKSNV
jgi:hypothetical protein